MTNECDGAKTLTNRTSWNEVKLEGKAFFKQLFVRKPMVDLQIEIDTEGGLPRRLNWIQLIAIGLGNTIGFGIFVLSGQAAAQHAGPAVIISFILSGFVALLTSLSFSELGGMMALSGSAFTYTYAALGEYAAWFIGWNSGLLYFLGVLTVSVAWSKYIVIFIDLVSDYNATSVIVEAPIAWNDHTERFFITGQVINLPAIAINLVTTAILISGIRQTATINLVLVVIKITILLLFIFGCCIYVNRDNYSPFIPPNKGSFEQYGITGILQASTNVFFAYIGFESITTAAKEAKSPENNIPFATISTTVISILLYVGISTVMVGLVRYNLLNSESPLAEALQATPYGLWLKVVMILGAIASLTTVILTIMLAQTRIFYAMAHDGLLPRIFAKLQPRTRTPWVSTLISGILCSILSGILPIDIIGETVSISALITYVFVHITVIVMRYTHADMPRKFKVPFGSWLIPTIGCLLCMILMAFLTAASGIRFLIWTALGQIVYFTYGLWHSKRRLFLKVRQTNSSIELVKPATNKNGEVDRRHSLDNVDKLEDEDDFDAFS